MLEHESCTLLSRVILPVDGVLGMPFCDADCDAVAVEEEVFFDRLLFRKLRSISPSSVSWSSSENITGDFIKPQENLTPKEP